MEYRVMIMLKFVIIESTHGSLRQSDLNEGVRSCFLFKDPVVSNLKYLSRTHCIFSHY